MRHVLRRRSRRSDLEHRHRSGTGLLDRIQAFIAKQFAGHGLAGLVGAVLEAEGFRCQIADPGSKAAKQELRNQFFKVRVWSADALLDALMRTYPVLGEDLRAELPLKQIWALVEEAE